MFSEHEKTALVQHEGGPCAVIAPVQGYIIKNVLFDEIKREDISSVTGTGTFIIKRPPYDQTKTMTIYKTV